MVQPVGAIIQIFLFLLGTILMVVAYFLGSKKATSEEFKLITIATADFTTIMGREKADHWEYVGFSTEGPTAVTVLLKRTQ